MKKTLLVLILISSAVFTFAEEYYESNILGMKLKVLDSPYDAETEWILKVNQGDKLESRILERDGIQVSITEVKTEGNTVTEVKMADKVTNTVIRVNGIVISELTERVDGTSELTAYNYTGRRLESAEVSINGERLYSDKYFYTDSGRLLDVEREYEDSSEGLKLSFIFIDGRISRFWMDSGNSKNYIRFDKSGIVRSELFGSEEWNETREYVRLADGTRVELISNQVDNITVKLEYDSNNRLIKSIRKDENDSILEESTWFYEDELLSQFRLRRDLSLEVFYYEWSDEGILSTESYYKNGNIIQHTEYHSEKDFTETLYQNGRERLKIYYTDGVRSSTEQIQEM